MGWFDGFPFKTQKQVEKERKTFENRVFPLGLEAQRDAARTVLREALTTKAEDEQLLFPFICGKDAYVSAMEDEEPPRVAALFAIRHLRWLSSDEKKIFLALIELDIQAGSLENYPTADMVRAAASEIAL